MITNPSARSELTLGGYLRDRREHLAPAPGTQSRRRTPGLRREEVAARAGVSVAWYTWLEQGRGGPPSDDVLEGLAAALELDAGEREVLFLLAQQRPPTLRPALVPTITPALQRMLDSMPVSPAYIKTPAWDIVAQNAAAAIVLTDYMALPPGERNSLRRMFGAAADRPALADWEVDARFALAAFRVDVARAGDYPEAAELAAELQATSPDFRRLWSENEMRSLGAGVKRLMHPVAGLLTLEYATFSVDGGNGLSMIVFTPVTPDGAAAIEALVTDRSRGGSS
jgi:transcriptional regulator with XRE-family HTH domain